MSADPGAPRSRRTIRNLPGRGPTADGCLGAAGNTAMDGNAPCLRFSGVGFPGSPPRTPWESRFRAIRRSGVGRRSVGDRLLTGPVRLSPRRGRRPRTPSQGPTWAPSRAFHRGPPMVSPMRAAAATAAGPAGRDRPAPQHRHGRGARPAQPARRFPWQDRSWANRRDRGPEHRPAAGARRHRRPMAQPPRLAPNRAPLQARNEREKPSLAFWKIRREPTKYSGMGFAAA